MKASKHNILYVDDKEVNLQLFKRQYDLEYNIFLAESGYAGLEVLENEKIDLIITNRRMPEMTGLQFLQKIEKK